MLLWACILVVHGAVRFVVQMSVLAAVTEEEVLHRFMIVWTTLLVVLKALILEPWADYIERLFIRHERELFADILRVHQSS